VVRGDDIEERLIDFAVRIIGVCDSLPDMPAGRHVRGQLLRSGTSPAPNYAEARGAESAKHSYDKAVNTQLAIQQFNNFLPLPQLK
jgi:four helix bundle protein